MSSFTFFKDKKDPHRELSHAVSVLSETIERLHDTKGGASLEQAAQVISSLQKVVANRGFDMQSKQNLFDKSAVQQVTRQNTSKDTTAQEDAELQTVALGSS